MSPNILAAYNTENKTYYIDFTPLLRRATFQGVLAETISSITSLVEVTTTDLTLGSKAVNTAAIVRDEQDVSEVPYDTEIAIGAAAQFTCTGGDEGEKYLIKATVATTDSRTLVEVVPLQIKVTTA